MGSLAFVAAARAAWGVVRDPEDDDRRLFLPVKNNLADATGLSFTITDGKVEWSPEPVLISIDELPEKGRDDTPREEAKRWLAAALEEGNRPAKELRKEAQADGIAKRTLERAKRELGVESVQEDLWMWVHPRKIEIDGEAVQQDGFKF